jgi:hypothetical protein
MNQRGGNRGPGLAVSSVGSTVRRVMSVSSSDLERGL